MIGYHFLTVPHWTMGSTGRGVGLGLGEAEGLGVGEVEGFEVGEAEGLEFGEAEGLAVGCSCVFGKRKGLR